MAHKKKINNVEKKVDELVKPTIEAKEESKKLGMTLDSLYENYPVRFLTNTDASWIKELFTLSNNVAALKKQIEDRKLAIIKTRELAEEIKKGKVKGPFMQKVSDFLYVPLFDIGDLAEKMLNEANDIEAANDISMGQLHHRYDEYIDALLRVRGLITQILGKFSDMDKTKTISGHRRVPDIVEKERVLIEKEFDDLTKQDKELIKNLFTEQDETKKAEIAKKLSEGQ